jgi:phytoene dehydrogenase-like protein
MQNRFDAIVVGSGLGGLMASAGLARAGWKVLVLEQLPFIGGRYTEIDYKGYLITTGAWTNQGPRAPIATFMDEVGAYVPYITHHDILDASGQPSSISKYRLGDGSEYLHMNEFLSREVVRGHGTALSTPISEETDAISTRQLMEKYFKDELGLKIVNCLAGMWCGVNMDDLPATVYIEIAKQIFSWGKYMGFPRGGVRSLINALAGVVLGHGGQIQTLSRVKKIVVKDGAAQGVELADGSLVNARVVIHNAGAPSLLKLAGRENLPEDYCRRTDSYLPLHVGQFVLGLKAPLLKDAPALISPDTKIVTGVFEPTFYDPTIAPPGHHQVEVFWEMKTEDLQYEHDLAWADMLTLYPHLPEILDLKLCFYYRGAWPGAFVGQKLGQLQDERVPTMTPIKDLYLVGFDAVGWGIGAECIPPGVRVVLGHLVGDSWKVRKS